MAYEMARNALYDYPGTALFYWLSLAREVFMRSIFGLGVGWEGGGNYMEKWSHATKCQDKVGDINRKICVGVLLKWDPREQLVRIKDGYLIQVTVILLFMMS